MGFEDGEDDVAAAAGDGGEGGAVGFALLAFGLVAFGVWVVLDGDEGGLALGVGGWLPPRLWVVVPGVRPERRSVGASPA